MMDADQQPGLWRMVLRHPFCLVPLLLVFADEWRHSRAGRYFWQGLPAVLVALAVVALVWVGRQTPQSRLVDRYTLAARRALQAGELEAADVYFRRLVELDAGRPDHLFGLAMTHYGRGQTERAGRLVDRLAPADRPGYAPAHFWQARQMLEHEDRLTAPMLQQLDHHLTEAVQQQRDHVEAHALLGQLLAVTGGHERAAGHLAQAVEARPELRLMLARVYRTLNKKESARQQAERAAAYFSERAQADPEDVHARLNWAEARMLLGQWPEAARILERAWQTSRDDRYRRALTSVYLFWSDRLSEKALRPRIELLQRALHYAPQEPAVLNRLALLAGAGGRAGEQARGALKDLLADGTAPATVHLILGTGAAEQNDFSRALLHLEQAYRLNPRYPLVVNNLAWVLARSEPPQLERAAGLAQAAVELMPNNAEIRETRGQILAQLGRHQEALADLQIALQAMPNHGPVHQTLAAIYEQLGDQEQAARHRQRGAAESK